LHAGLRSKRLAADFVRNEALNAYCPGMAQIESPDTHEAFFDALEQARARLEPPPDKARAWPAVAAAAFFALAAMAFATAAILAPPAQIAPVTEIRPAV
jgi:hypothetical protein